MKLTYNAVLDESLQFGLPDNIQMDFVLRNYCIVAVCRSSADILIAEPFVQGQQRVQAFNGVITFIEAWRYANDDDPTFRGGH